jgi:hypothetical protein
MNSISCQVKLGRDNFTRDWFIRIGFAFPKTVRQISHVSPDDPNINVYFIPAEKFPLNHFIGLSPVEMARQIRLCHSALGFYENYYLKLLVEFLENKLDEQRRQELLLKVK